MTSDRIPKAMATLEERLRSRFEWGLIVDIQSPDYETRMAILQTKAERMQVEVPNNLLSYIATNIESNIRELEGRIKQSFGNVTTYRYAIDQNRSRKSPGRPFT